MATSTEATVDERGIDERGIDERSYVEAARKLQPQISEAAAEGEAARCVTPEVMEAIRDQGLLRLLLPRALGGPEISPQAFIDAIEALSYADGSTGWSSLILNGTYFLAWLEPDVAAAILRDDPDLAIAGTFAPTGRAVPVTDDTFTVDGRWAFNSGCPYASWLVEGVMVMDGDSPRMVPPGRPDWRFVLMPADVAEVHDTWNVAGLRGTASHDVSVTAVAVPESHTLAPLFVAPHHDGPFFRWPFFTGIAALIAGFPLGVAQRALDEATELTATKSRSFDGAALNTEAPVILTLGRAHHALSSARNRVADVVGRLWDTAVAGDPPSIGDRGELRLTTIAAMRTAVEVVDTAFRLGGGNALYDASVLQRCWRDLHAGSHHIFFGEQSELRASKALLGMPTEEFML